MPYRVLVSAPYLQPVLDRFRPAFTDKGIELVVPPVSERLEERDLLPLIGDIDGVICGDDRFTRNVLQQASRLKVISKWGTGIDSIDREACREFGIAVCNTPNAFSEPVADSVMGYILCFARRQPWMDRAMHAGVWQKIQGRALRETTIGVIGIGNVGRAVIRRATAFGMTVLGTDVVAPSLDYLEASGVSLVPLEELLTAADFISVNCDLNPTSHHLLNRERFALMKASAVVINTARGPIIDEIALVEALAAGRLAGAGLDVFEYEPLPEESPLRTMDNVMLAPHNANSSPEAWERVHANTLANLFAGLGA